MNCTDYRVTYRNQVAELGREKRPFEVEYSRVLK